MLIQFPNYRLMKLKLLKKINSNNDACKMNSLRFLLFVAVLLFCAVFHLNGETIIRIHPEKRHSVGGHDEIQRIFGVCVNGTTKNELINEIRDLNLNSA